MANILDVVASRVSRDLTRQKLAGAFKAKPSTVSGTVLGRQLAMINGNLAPTTIDGSGIEQATIEFANVGRPALAVYAPTTSISTAQASNAGSGSGGAVVSGSYVPTSRRISTIWPILGGNTLAQDLTLSLAEDFLTADALTAIIVPSATIDTEIVNGKLELSVIPQTVDADTLDGYHAADLMPPAGTITGDFLRWNDTAEAWEVEHEPIAVAGLIMTPQASIAATEGAMYYDAATRHLMVYTEA